MTKFESQGFHIIIIKYENASASGSPPSVIPALCNIARHLFYFINRLPRQNISVPSVYISQNLILIFSIAALWKFNIATNKFKNKKGYTLMGEFELVVQTGEDGNIKIKAKNGNQVLGFEDSVENTKIELQDIKSSGDKNQLWKFSQINNLPGNQGFFTIESVSTKMLLHGDSKGKAFLGSEFFNLKYDYNTEPKSKLITSRKSIRVEKRSLNSVFSFLRCRLADKR